MLVTAPFTCAAGILSFGQLVHELASAGVIARRVEDVGSQRDDITVLRGIGGGFDGSDFLFETLYARIRSMPT